MDDTLVNALLITAIGMTLLFLTLVFFYGLLSLLTAAIQDRPSSDGSEPAPATSHADGAKLEAAAIAIALARSQASPQTTPYVPQTEAHAAPGPDRWWLLHHQRRLAHNPDTRRRR